MLLSIYYYSYIYGFCYVDTIIQTPMSKDSKEYSKFESLYNNRAINTSNSKNLFRYSRK